MAKFNKEDIKRVAFSVDDAIIDQMVADGISRKEATEYLNDTKREMVIRVV